MLDLGTLGVATAASTGTIVELEHPATGRELVDDEGKPYYVEVRGEDSPEVRAVDRKHADRRSERIRKQKDPGLDQESLEHEGVERLTAATIEWYLPLFEGRTLDFNAKNASLVYGDPELAWIPEQVARAMKDRKRFFSKPSTI